MDETTIFDDLSIEETILFGDNIKAPFSDFPHVFRAVITTMSSDLAQRTPAAWYQELLEGMPVGWEPPEPELPKPPAHFGAADEAKWRKGVDKAINFSALMDKRQLWICWMTDKVGKGVQAGNLMDWAMDVVSVNPDLSALELRRKITDEFKAESRSAGSWDLWLCDLAWISDRRDALAAGEAPPKWADYKTHKLIGEKKKLGVDTFMAWLNGQNQEDMGPDEDGDSPLVPASVREEEVAAIGV